MDDFLKIIRLSLTKIIFQLIKTKGELWKAKKFWLQVQGGS